MLAALQEQHSVRIRSSVSVPRIDLVTECHFLFMCARGERLMANRRREVIIKDTHRGLLYEDGVLMRVLEAGRYELPAKRAWLMERLFGRRPNKEIVIVDMRERDLLLKGQEILTSAV
jgi:hypothetical protein